MLSKLAKPCEKRQIYYFMQHVIKISPYDRQQIILALVYHSEHVRRDSNEPI